MPAWEWMENAACQGEDLVLFFGPPGESTIRRLMREETATQVCRYCPVRAACLEYALTSNEKSGVWGGMGETERAGERRRRQRRGARPAAERSKPRVTRTPVFVVKKRCTHCGETKPADDCGFRPTAATGLTSWCRACSAEKRRERRHGSAPEATAEEAVAS